MSRWWDLIDFESRSDDLKLLQNLGSLLINLNSALNPLLYYLFSRGFMDLFNGIQKLQRRDLRRTSEGTGHYLTIVNGLETTVVSTQSVVVHPHT